MDIIDWPQEKIDALLKQYSETEDIDVTLQNMGKRIAELEEENKQLREVEDKINDLEDRFKNGIKYDENYNHYIVCWTERELELAKVRAEALAKFFKKALEER